MITTVVVDLKVEEVLEMTDLVVIMTGVKVKVVLVNPTTGIVLHCLTVAV